jgi:hypothetical protein
LLKYFSAAPVPRNQITFTAACGKNQAFFAACSRGFPAPPAAKIP